jgi:hypothetical protein
MPIATQVRREERRRRRRREMKEKGKSRKNEEKITDSFQRRDESTIGRE